MLHMHMNQIQTSNRMKRIQQNSRKPCKSFKSHEMEATVENLRPHYIRHYKKYYTHLYCMIAEEYPYVSIQ